MPNRSSGTRGRGLTGRNSPSNREPARALPREGLAETMKERSSYVVRLERDASGWWLAQVPAIRGCITQGRTIEQACARTREAIQAMLDLAMPYAGELVPDVRLPATARKLVDEANTARSELQQAEQVASQKSREAVRKLNALGLSLRDAGELIGVSRQRAQQLLEGPDQVGISAADKHRIAGAIHSPPAPAAALRRAVRRSRALLKGSR
jgi:predicted RNase H-like HicB family nuclease